MTPAEQEALGNRLENLFLHLLEPAVEELAKILTGERVISVISTPLKNGEVRHELHLIDGAPEVLDPRAVRVKEALIAIKAHHGEAEAKKIIWRHAGAGSRLADLMKMPGSFDAVLKDCGALFEKPAAWRLTDEELASLG